MEVIEILEGFHVYFAFRAKNIVDDFEFYPRWWVLIFIW